MTDIVLQPRSGEHKRSLIWLHGIGGNPDGHSGYFLNEDISMIDQYTKVIIPEAKERKITATAGMTLTSWFDFFTLEAKPQEAICRESFQESFDGLVKLIKEEEAVLPNGLRDVFVGGFSQGACLAMEVALSTEMELGGLIACNSFYLNFQPIQQLKTPICIYYAQEDPVMPSLLLSYTFKRLLNKRSGVHFIVDTHDMHDISSDGLLQIRNWFSSVVSENPRLVICKL